MTVDVLDPRAMLGVYRRESIWYGWEFVPNADGPFGGEFRVWARRRFHGTKTYHVEQRITELKQFHAEFDLVRQSLDELVNVLRHMEVEPGRIPD